MPQPVSVAVSTVTATGAAAPGTVTRSEVKTRPFTTVVEPRDALLRFARDYLVASGARVRVEDADLLSATLQDDRTVRYTTSLARARNEEQTELLVQGGTALAELLDECAARSRLVALRLWDTGDPVAIARAALAAPVSRCTICAPALDDQDASRSDAMRFGTQHCERCPWRENRTVLAGFGPTISSGQERRRRESQSVELTFHMIGTDRRGRHDEWKRVAFDLATGRETALLSLNSVLRMDTNDDTKLETTTGSTLEAAIGHGQAVLSPAATALATFLRLRGEEDYQRRSRDIRTTYDRLLREGSEDKDLVHSAFQRELMRLAESYAVDVEVQLDSIALITTVIAEVSLRDGSGKKTITVDVDLGRACMLPLSCDLCRSSLQSGRRCSRGHLICARCTLSAEPAAGGEPCPVCRQVPAPLSIAARAHTSSTLQTAPASGNLTRSDQLHATDLDAMTPETWHLFATWLLERMGYTSERSESGEHGSRFFGHLGERQFVAAALRLPEGSAVGKVEVQSVAALGAGSPDRQVLLITTSVVGKEAMAAAHDLDVTLVERAELETLLEQQEAAHTREVAAEAQAAEERALRAETTRTSVLSLLDQMEDALARAVNTRKTGTRAVLLESVERISAGTAVCTQAFVAWETLTTDWTAAFGEHEGRDGDLLITADLATLDEIGERARHLAAVTLQALGQVQETPGAGELGYTAWRKAVVEELLARCDAVRCRFNAILPTAWQDYSKARDTAKLQQAEEATVVASYARGRAEKALAQLQTRARIAVTR
jgi:hypothetical protein